MKNATTLMFLAFSILSFSKQESSINIEGTWKCAAAKFNSESSDSRVAKYLTLFQGSEFHFEENGKFTLKKPNAENGNSKQIIIDSYWKFNKENQIIVDYKNPSSILKIVIEIKEEDIYFLIFDQTMSLKMEKVTQD